MMYVRSPSKDAPESLLPFLVLTLCWLFSFFYQLPMEPNYLGFHSPWAFLWYFFFLIAPLAYIYIALMLLRDLCEYFPETVQKPLAIYFPFLARVTTMMKSYYGCRFVDIWCMIEAAFFIFCKLKIRYLQSKDPLEACLSAAPMLDPEERKALWEHIMAAESEPSWLEEWFLDRPSIESIRLYDIYDFVCWAMFDGRNQEHLTTDELNDLEGYVDDLEYRISLQLYGISEEEDNPDIASPIGLDTSGRISVDSMDGSIRATNRTRTFSDAATASDVDNIDSFNYDLHSVDETKYSSPMKYAVRDFAEGETPKSIKSGSWSSLPSIQRPKPKKCKCNRLIRQIDFEIDLDLFSHFLSTRQCSSSEEMSNVKGRIISRTFMRLTRFTTIGIKI